MHHLGRVILRAQDVSGFEQRGKSPRTQLGECLQLPAWEERVSLHRRLGRRGERGRGKTREETGQGASQEGGSQVPRATERSRGQSNKVKKSIRFADTGVTGTISQCCFRSMLRGEASG